MVASSNGVRVFNNVDEYKQYDNLRKQNKKVVRQQQAQQLQPEINSPTLEDLTRRLGGTKLEKEVAQQFNNSAKAVRILTDLAEKLIKKKK